MSAFEDLIAEIYLIYRQNIYAPSWWNFDSKFVYCHSLEISTWACWYLWQDIISSCYEVPDLTSAPRVRGTTKYILVIDDNELVLLFLIFPIIYYFLQHEFLILWSADWHSNIVTFWRENSEISKCISHVNYLNEIWLSTISHYECTWV